MIKDWMLLSSYFSLDFIKDQILSSSVQQGIPVTRVAFVGDGKPSKGSTYKLHHILHVPKFLWTAYSRRSRVSKSYRYGRFICSAICQIAFCNCTVASEGGLFLVLLSLHLGKRGKVSATFIVRLSAVQDSEMINKSEQCHHIAVCCNL